jgi:glycerol-3-phosphate dehydrogenase (NAD(P)+)
MATVSIIGAGMMGTAMCWPLVENQHQVNLVGTPLDSDIIQSLKRDGYHPTLQRTVPPDVRFHSVEELPGAMPGVDLVISGVSSFGVDWFGETVGPLLGQSQPVLAVTKGLEDQPNGDLLTLPEATQRKLPFQHRENADLNAIAGPCIAHELAARRPTGVVFTGKNPKTLSWLREQLSTDYYHISTSLDVVGVEVCAALKNAYALAVGLGVGMMEAAGRDGLAVMYNIQAAIFGQSTLEMRRMLKVLGGGAGNVSWLPGAGDLFVTVFGGRTVRLGRMLGQGLPIKFARQRLAGVTLESVEIVTRVARALPKLESRGLLSTADYPLICHLDEIINQGLPVRIPWRKFRMDCDEHTLSD